MSTHNFLVCCSFVSLQQNEHGLWKWHTGAGLLIKLPTNLLTSGKLLLDIGFLGLKNGILNHNLIPYCCMKNRVLKRHLILFLFPFADEEIEDVL